MVKTEVLDTPPLKDKYLIKHEGKVIECDRVTNILSATKSSGGLAAWYGREERKGIIELLNSHGPVSVRSLPMDDDDNLFGSRARDSKAGSGSGIHALIHAEATNTALPDDVIVTPEDYARFKEWSEFVKQEGITYVDSEKRVYSVNLYVAGTLDETFMWKDQLWLGDTKTGRLKRDAAVQMVVYWMLRTETLALETGDKETFERLTEAYSTGRLPHFDWPKFLVVHLPIEGMQLYEVDSTLLDNLARQFLYRLSIYRSDQTMRPFRRIHPIKTLKDGSLKTQIWLRAS